MRYLLIVLVLLCEFICTASADAHGRGGLSRAEARLLREIRRQEIRDSIRFGVLGLGVGRFDRFDRFDRIDELRLRQRLRSQSCR